VLTSAVDKLSLNKKELEYLFLNSILVENITYSPAWIKSALGEDKSFEN
jgi:hypothetical protein